MVKKFKHRYGRYHRRDIVVLGEVPTDCLDDTTVRLQAKYSVNMTKSEKKIFSSLHYDGSMFFVC